MIEIKLPEEVKTLIEGSIFDIESNVNDDQLAKFLFYVPELTKTYGLAMAELRRKKRDIEKKVWVKEQELEVLSAELLLEIDPGTYKNEALRGAKISSNPEVGGIRGEILEFKKEILDIESDLDELGEMYWSFKSLRESLSDISKIRVAERRM